MSDPEHALGRDGNELRTLPVLEPGPRDCFERAADGQARRKPGVLLGLHRIRAAFEEVACLVPVVARLLQADRRIRADREALLFACEAVFHRQCFPPAGSTSR
jgi:hypothetical protein